MVTVSKNGGRMRPSHAAVWTIAYMMLLAACSAPRLHANTKEGVLSETDRTALTDQISPRLVGYVPIAWQNANRWTPTPDKEVTEYVRLVHCTAPILIVTCAKQVAQPDHPDLYAALAPNSDRMGYAATLSVRIFEIDTPNGRFYCRPSEELPLGPDGRRPYQEPTGEWAVLTVVGRAFDVVKGQAIAPNTVVELLVDKETTTPWYCGYVKGIAGRIAPTSSPTPSPTG